METFAKLALWLLLETIGVDSVLPAIGSTHSTSISHANDSFAAHDATAGGIQSTVRKRPDDASSRRTSAATTLTRYPFSPITSVPPTDLNRGVLASSSANAERRAPRDHSASAETRGPGIVEEEGERGAFAEEGHNIGGGWDGDDLSEGGSRVSASGVALIATFTLLVVLGCCLVHTAKPLVRRRNDERYAPEPNGDGGQGAFNAQELTEHATLNLKNGRADGYVFDGSSSSSNTHAGVGWGGDARDDVAQGGGLQKQSCGKNLPQPSASTPTKPLSNKQYSMLRRVHDQGRGKCSLPNTAGARGSAPSDDNIDSTGGGRAGKDQCHEKLEKE
eukprot:gene14379-27401_t